MKSQIYNIVLKSIFENNDNQIDFNNLKALLSNLGDFIKEYESDKKNLENQIEKLNQEISTQREIIKDLNNLIKNNSLGDAIPIFEPTEAREQKLNKDLPKQTIIDEVVINNLNEVNKKLLLIFYKINGFNKNSILTLKLDKEEMEILPYYYPDVYFGSDQSGSRNALALVKLISDFTKKNGEKKSNDCIEEDDAYIYETLINLKKINIYHLENSEFISAILFLTNKFVQIEYIYKQITYKLQRKLSNIINCKKCESSVKAIFKLDDDGNVNLDSFKKEFSPKCPKLGVFNNSFLSTPHPEIRNRVMKKFYNKTQSYKKKSSSNSTQNRQNEPSSSLSIVPQNNNPSSSPNTLTNAPQLSNESTESDSLNIHNNSYDSIMDED